MGALTDTSVLPAVVQKYWDRKLLSRALPAVVHNRAAQRRPLAMRSGKVMAFRRMESLGIDTAPLIEGRPPTGEQLTYTDLNVTIQQWGNYVPMTDLVEITTDHPVLNETNKLLAEQSARVIDSLLRDVAVATTNKFYGGNAANRASILGVDQKVDVTLFDRINRNLQSNNATMFSEMIAASVKYATFPIRESWLCITTPEVYFSLQNLPGWVSVEEYGSTGPVMANEVGSYRNFRFLVSTLAKKYLGGGGTFDSSDAKATSGLCDVHTILVFGKEAIASVPLEGDSLQNIIKPLGSGGTSDPLNQHATSGWKHTGARVILNDAFMAVAEVAVANVTP